MKHLLTKLSLGLHKEDLSKQFIPFVEDLLHKGYIKLLGDTYRLNSKYRFGSITLTNEKKGAYLHAYGEAIKDIFIAKEDMQEAKSGDIVVVQRYIAKKGPPSGKVVEILGRISTTLPLGGPFLAI